MPRDDQKADVAASLADLCGHGSLPRLRTRAVGAIPIIGTLSNGISNPPYVLLDLTTQSPATGMRIRWCTVLHAINTPPIADLELDIGDQLMVFPSGQALNAHAPYIRVKTAIFVCLPTQTSLATREGLGGG